MPNCPQEERAQGETYQQRLTDKGESTNIGDHLFEVVIYIYIYLFIIIYLFIHLFNYLFNYLFIYIFVCVFIYLLIYIFIYLIICKYTCHKKWHENDSTIYETSISMYIMMTYETNIGSITFWGEAGSP